MQDVRAIHRSAKRLNTGGARKPPLSQPRSPAETRLRSRPAWVVSRSCDRLAGGGCTGAESAWPADRMYAVACARAARRLPARRMHKTSTIDYARLVRRDRRRRRPAKSWSSAGRATRGAIAAPSRSWWRLSLCRRIRRWSRPQCAGEGLGEVQHVPERRLPLVHVVDERVGLLQAVLIAAHNL
jgi:hypothetical protein